MKRGHETRTIGSDEDEARDSLSSTVALIISCQIKIQFAIHSTLLGNKGNSNSPWKPRRKQLDISSIDLSDLVESSLEETHCKGAATCIREEVVEIVAHVDHLCKPIIIQIMAIMEEDPWASSHRKDMLRL